MKVLAAIVVPPHLAVSGAARAAEELSASLGHRCDMAVASMAVTAVSAPIEGRADSVVRLPVKTWLPPMLSSEHIANRYKTLFYRSNLPELVGQAGYDLVHLHNPLPALELERVAQACLDSGIPYLISTHGFNEVYKGQETYGLGRVQSLLWKRIVTDPLHRVLGRADAVYAFSPADFDIVRALGYSGDHLRVVANGAPKPAPPDQPGDAAILSRYGMPAERQSGRITCMFLANHTPNKGLPHLLEAFADLEEPYILIVGGDRRSGIDYDGAIRRCRPGQEIIITGRLSDRDVVALFRRSDLFVFPTLADTFPLVILEAMSYGLPIIASRVGGIPFQVDEGCGLLIPPGDPQALREAFQALAGDAKRRAVMGRNASLRVASNFTWERAADLAFEGYQQVLAARAFPAKGEAQARQSKDSR